MCNDLCGLIAPKSNVPVEMKQIACIIPVQHNLVPNSACLLSCVRVEKHSVERHCLRAQHKLNVGKHSGMRSEHQQLVGLVVVVQSMYLDKQPRTKPNCCCRVHRMCHESTCCILRRVANDSLSCRASPRPFMQQGTRSFSKHSCQTPKTGEATHTLAPASRTWPT